MAFLGLGSLLEKSVVDYYNRNKYYLGERVSFQLKLMLTGLVGRPDRHESTTPHLSQSQSSAPSLLACVFQGREKGTLQPGLMALVLPGRGLQPAHSLEVSL